MVIKPPKYKDVQGIRITKKLSGGDSTRVVYIFNYAVLYELIKIIYAAFMDKAAGKSDNFGNSWEPLSKKLYDWKLKSRKRTAVKIGGVPAINIRTRELQRALRPGQFIGGKYIPNPGQRIFVTSNHIQLVITVEHAGKVQEVRPFFPEDLEPLVDIAVAKAVRTTNSYLKEIGFNWPPTPPISEKKK